MMCTPRLILLISIVACQEVYENTERANPTYNVTTLYPVTNKTIDSIKLQRNHTEAQNGNYKANIIDEEQDNRKYEGKDELEISVPKKNITKWKIDATYAQPKETVEVNEPKETIRKVPEVTFKEQVSTDKPMNGSEDKEFKPSPHLGSFFDDENLSLLKFSTAEPYIPTEKKPALDFISSKDLYMLNYKSPTNYRDQIDAPYRFENSYFPTKFWKQTLDSKPTVESSIKVPAGGLYKHSNPFKEKPSSNGDDDDFGLGFNEYGKDKENPVKKRSNPWKNLLNLVTAFLPVGLIISALTPSVITLHSTGNDIPVNRFSRRSDGGFAAVPPISERCKRRLLCEIHSDENYIRFQNKPAGYVRKHCYKIHCEDPQSLNRVLQWLLSHQPGSSLHHAPTQHRPAQHNKYRDDRYRSDAMNYKRKDLT